MPDTPLIRFDRVEKCFGEHVVLRGLDLDVRRGEKIAIIGPSGSGKSTVLRLLMTLERLTAGRIEIDGQSLWTMRKGAGEVPADEQHLRKMRQRFGMVFQQFNLFPHLTVLRNLTLAPHLVQKTNLAAANERARELLSIVGLDDKAEAFPAHLSGGQKQRVAIARALALEPDIMLFDEITSALDPELVNEVLNVLRRLAHETEMTMLIVTHELSFAREIADRVLFFEAGEIVEDGSPEQVLSNPRSTRVREFLGPAYAKTS